MFLSFHNNPKIREDSQQGWSLWPTRWTTPVGNPPDKSGGFLMASDEKRGEEPGADGDEDEKQPPTTSRDKDNKTEDAGEEAAPPDENEAEDQPPPEELEEVDPLLWNKLEQVEVDNHPSSQLSEHLHNFYVAEILVSTTRAGSKQAASEGSASTFHLRALFIAALLVSVSTLQWMLLKSAQDLIGGPQKAKLSKMLEGTKMSVNLTTIDNPRARVFTGSEDRGRFSGTTRRFWSAPSSSALLSHRDNTEEKL